MAIYLGDYKVKINSNGIVYNLNLFSSTPTLPTFSGVRILSSEGYILKDFSGLYLTAKEDE